MVAARGRRRADLIARLRQRLAERPPAGVAAVVLFGSVARNDFDGFSDIDLLVIGRDSLDRALFDDLGRGVDVLAVPPAQAATPAGAVAEALAEGVVLWGSWDGLPPAPG
ncbi:nucleotidyltransferase domain-containing protein [Caenispirillum bisanense]|uniref:nucleotidyltransferase family protein n=1 Tax=Caenispirillum bisanense TaxID=414052 RepID=UPI0031E35D54